MAQLNHLLPESAVGCRQIVLCVVRVFHFEKNKNKNPISGFLLNMKRLELLSATWTKKSLKYLRQSLRKGSAKVTAAEAAFLSQVLCYCYARSIYVSARHIGFNFTERGLLISSIRVSARSCAAYSNDSCCVVVLDTRKVAFCHHTADATINLCFSRGEY